MLYLCLGATHASVKGFLVSRSGLKHRKNKIIGEGGGHLLKAKEAEGTRKNSSYSLSQFNLDVIEYLQDILFLAFFPTLGARVFIT